MNLGRPRRHITPGAYTSLRRSSRARARHRGGERADTVGGGVRWIGLEPIRAAGFRSLELEEFRVERHSPLDVVAPHVAGVARR